MAKAQIPLHSFAQDDATSIPFNLIPLERKTDYDASVPHRHNYYEIFVFLEGGGVHDIDFNRIAIEPGSLHFVSPGQVHHVQRSLDSSGYVMFFSREFYYLNLQNKNILFELPFLNNNSDRPILNLDSSTFAQVLMLIQQMEKEFSSDNPLKEEIVRSYLNIILIQCKRLFEERYPEDEGSSHSGLFQDFRILLETHFAELHKVSDYAALLHITEKHLNETCKKSRGKTASELIYDRIILEAKRLLLHSDFSNKEIAYFLHFDDPSHFSKFFKNKVGQSPNDFRKTKEG